MSDYINPNEQDGGVIAASEPAAATAIDNNTSVTVKQELLREALPACQPQEGSPANTFTLSELQELQAALNINDLDIIRPRSSNENSSNNTTAKDDDEDAASSSSEELLLVNTTTASNLNTNTNQIDICGPWVAPPPITNNATAATTTLPPEKATLTKEEKVFSDTKHVADDAIISQQLPVDYYTLPRTFRQDVRYGRFHKPTNGVCPGYLQCNLVVLPAGKLAFDFLLFCQRNSQACPLLEVCEGTTTSYVPQQLAEGADLRTDIPKYAIYRDGKLEQEVTDCTEFWPEDAVAFLIGCSFSYDGALQDAGIPLKSADANKNVPMYKTNIPCQSAGCLGGNMVVSMKPIPATKITKHVEITSKYKHAHGGPVCVGCPQAIGIANIDIPEWGDAIDIDPNHEVPVFHACGVTPQAVLMDSKVPFAITHSAGYMFVTDRPSDMGLI